MGKATTTATLPLGRVAQGWLNGLMAFQRHASPIASGLIVKLYREHHAAIPWADDAVRDVHAALSEAGALDEYEAWRAANSAVSGWPTREAEERRRRTLAV